MQFRWLRRGRSLGKLPDVLVMMGALGIRPNGTLITGNDVGPFILVLLGIDTDPRRRARADVSGDGVVDGNDIQPFIALITP